VGLYVMLTLQPSEAERDDAVPTIAVLPFESLGADSGQAYLARGISGELGAELSRLPGLRVIASPTTAPGRAVPGARYLVSGSVQRLDGHLRFNVQVLDTETGRPLWSERFDRPFRDLFQVQDEVLRRVAEVLPGKLAQAAREQAARRYTRSIEAYDWFLQAQARFLIRKAEDNEAARALYKKSLAADPQFARAYAGLAMTHAIDFRLRPNEDGAADLARALELAEAARLIDPELPEVHWALAFVHAQGRRHEAAIESLRKAIELNRSFADAYAFLGGIYTYVGEPARSVPLLRTAMRFNPEGGYLYFLLLGRAYLFENDPEQALINLRQAAARNPDDMETRLFLAAAMAAAGDGASAEWEIEQIRTVHAGFCIHEWMKTYPLTSLPHRDRLLALLARAGLS
jgi:TolB-like protein